MLAGFIRLLAALFTRRSSSPPSAPPTFINLPVLTRVLKRGDSGDDVKALQNRLHDIGYSDLNIDGDFAEVTEAAVRQFQLARNLDPDGEVGDMSWAELAKTDAAAKKPPLLPPSTAKYGAAPQWYLLAEKDIGFHETGTNRGLDRFIAEAGYGANGWQWCKLFVGAKLKLAGYPSQANGLARSVEADPNFIQLPGPALGAIVTMWRGQKTPRGQGHIFFYDGESPLGIRGIGGNESDMVKRSFHARNRVVGYYWPKTAPPPAKSGAILVNSASDILNAKED